MSGRLTGVVLLPTDGAPAAAPVDIAFDAGRIAAITPAAGAGAAPAGDARVGERP